MHTVDFNILPMAPHLRVLDMGCGNGRHTAAAYEHSSVHVIGADRQAASVSQARDRLRFHASLSTKPSSLWSLAVADINHLPFQTHSCDIVICSEVLEHVPDHGRAVRELLRVLKPQGHLAISVPRRWPETVCWALSRQYRNSPDGHIRIYTADALIRLFRSQGAVHLHTHYAHSLHTPYWWLKCLLGLDRESLWPVQLYHRFLTWDMMAKPRITKLIDRWLNPLIGKSVVLYFKKGNLKTGDKFT